MIHDIIQLKLPELVDTLLTPYQTTSMSLATNLGTHVRVCVMDWRRSCK